jgi:hypothetical protein
MAGCSRHVTGLDVALQSSGPILQVQSNTVVPSCQVAGGPRLALQLNHGRVPWGPPGMACQMGGPPRAPHCTMQSCSQGILRVLGLRYHIGRPREGQTVSGLALSRDHGYLGSHGLDKNLFVTKKICEGKS